MRRSVAFARRSPSLLGIAVLALAACESSPVRPPEECPPPAAPAVVALPPGPYDPLYAAAAAEFGVPAALLRAIAHVETREQMVRGVEELGGRPAAFGVMALRGEALRQGAAAAGVSVRDAQDRAAANVRAAAALLAGWAASAGIDRSALDAWSAVVGRYSGITLAAGRRAYVAEVMAAAGAPGGPRAALGAGDCTKNPPPVEPPPALSPDYVGALFRPSPNFDERRAGAAGIPRMVIIHTCEGAYTGCWSWLDSPESEVSAHYVVREDGGEISQLVREASRAWHIGATYDCALNARAECDLNGVQSNHFTIGVEHAGYASQATWPAAQLAASARLVCDITRRQGIPRDGQHIVAHGQLQPYNRTDPGPNWPWARYLGMIQRECGELVADDDAAQDDTAWVRVSASAAWTASTDAAGYYGGGYRWATSGAGADDPLVLSFRLDEPARRTVDVRWTAGENRSPAAAFVVVGAAADTLGRVTVDQRGGGGEWRTLGSWTFPAGWSRVLVSRVGPAGVVVVADAARIR
ncbi:MAG TPA: N-acetylmuramoyl-L-alanine amidase [Longimicrobiales bacterium]|nr:N-acetylmuramoyl-L-alanine amidase [Longimicrobiales bacterium]